MATIAENIQTLRSIKSDIKNAIIQKGGSVTDAFGTYAQAITNLPSGGGGGTEIEDAFVTRTISGTYYNDRISMVGSCAFAYCSKLTSVNLPNCSETYFSAFDTCVLLSTINLPLCTSIAQGTFRNCSLLVSVSLPLCKYVSTFAFQGCVSLTSIYLPNCLHFGNNAVYNCINLTVAKLPLCISLDYACFRNCSSLTQLYLNSVSSVTKMMYSNAFSSCPNLTSVYVPASLVDAFKTAQYWSSISDKIVAYTEPTKYPPLIYSTNAAGSTITVNGQSVTLEQGDNITLDYPNEITSVKATNNTALTYIQIPNTVTSIESDAFNGCEGLEDITIPESVKTINNDAFNGCIALTSVTIPNSVTMIGDRAFEFCIGLTSINIPSGVTSTIATFNGCSALTSVTLPEGLTNIGDSTFMECTSLTSITIPSSVTMIESCAFDYCEALTDFNFNGTKAQWGAITLADDWKNNAAFTVVHCTDGDVNV